MVKERVYTYYLEPRGNVAHSNEILSKNIDEEDALQEVMCADGIKRNFWRCPSGRLFAIWQSRAGFSCFGKKFAIKIFAQEGKGKIRDITDWYKKRHQKKERQTYGRF